MIINEGHKTSSAHLQGMIYQNDTDVSYLVLNYTQVV